MSRWEIIWQFNTARFAVTYQVTDEPDLDLSWDEDGSVASGLDSGKFVAFSARVCVHLDNVIIGEDHLGNCIYDSAQAFIDHRGNGYHPIKPQGTACSGSYFADMVREAISQARKHINDQPKLRKAG